MVAHLSIVHLVKVDTPKEDRDTTSNLKEFGVDIDEPDLFSSENQNLSSEESSKTYEEDQDEDDLEIPAFLRRQKN